MDLNLSRARLHRITTALTKSSEPPIRSHRIGGFVLGVRIAFWIAHFSFPGKERRLFLGNVKLACNRKSHMSWQTCGAGSVPHLQLPCNLTPDSLLLCHPHSSRGTCY